MAKKKAKKKVAKKTSSKKKKVTKKKAKRKKSKAAVGEMKGDHQGVLDLDDMHEEMIETPEEDLLQEFDEVNEDKIQY